MNGFRHKWRRLERVLLRYQKTKQRVTSTASLMGGSGPALNGGGERNDKLDSNRSIPSLLEQLSEHERCSCKIFS